MSQMGIPLAYDFPMNSTCNTNNAQEVRGDLWRSFRNKDTCGPPFRKPFCPVPLATTLHQPIQKAPSIPPRTSSLRRTVLRAKKRSRVLPSTGDSGYASRASSPDRRKGLDLNSACPSIPRFSWQDHAGRISFHDAFRSLVTDVCSHKDPCWRTSLSASELKIVSEFPPVPSIFKSRFSPSMSSGKVSPRRPPSRSSISGPNSQMLDPNDSGTSALPSLNTSHQNANKSHESRSIPSRSSALQSPVRQAGAAASNDDIAGMRAHHRASNNILPGLVCNVHRTTGKKPPGLSGASTTIIGDRLYVFGGQELDTRRILRSMYELDLMRRHWRRLDPTGDSPSPRYFHSMCALGETKLVLFGGSTTVPKGSTASEKGTMPVADIHMYDIETNAWTAITTRNSPAPRYAHCATVLPSSAVFTSSTAPLSALHHNPSTNAPNRGKLGVEIDGRGGAEMVVVGGQYSEEQYTNTLDVFNFRSLTWTPRAEVSMHKCGAYRSVAATINSLAASQVGTPRSMASGAQSSVEDEEEEDAGEISGAPAIFYNNYNFVSPHVEVKLRRPDGTMADVEQRGTQRPPGLRFPTAGVVDKHFIVSGTFLRSSTEEYMLWALDLQTLVWHRIDIASGVFSSGSWNRGVPWSKRNSYVVLGDRTRPFKQDYEKRRINFKNFCTIELEAFGLYDNPHADYVQHGPHLSLPLQRSVIEDTVGNTALGLVEASDMEILAIDGEKIPVNSNLVSQRWGPYFRHLMSEDLGNKVRRDSVAPDATSLQPISTGSARDRTSNVTLTPTHSATVSSASGSTLANGGSSIVTDTSNSSDKTVTNSSRPLSLSMKQPVMRSRVLFLPHTYFTIRALVQYLYTSSLPPPSHHLCTPQVLCSLLQIARPYRIEGLLEATLERLHKVFDGPHIAAVFNAAAMAAGGGDAVKLTSDPGNLLREEDDAHEAMKSIRATSRNVESRQTIIEDDSETDTSVSTSSSTASLSDAAKGAGQDVWTGEWSSVIGLQKRALRGLMEAKKAREREKAEKGAMSPSVASS